MTDQVTFITPIYAGFFGIMLVVLSWRVTKLRLKHESTMKEPGHSDLAAAVRAQGNLVEYIPLALLLMWMLEIMRFNPLMIHFLGVFLILARVIHLHGLNQPGGNGRGRKIGTRLTWLHIFICSLLTFAVSFGAIH
jgi:uncharacterized membrane protein YecN with MAPEG domain